MTERRIGCEVGILRMTRTRAALSRLDREGLGVIGKPYAAAALEEVEEWEKELAQMLYDKDEDVALIVAQRDLAESRLEAIRQYVVYGDIPTVHVNRIHDLSDGSVV